MNPLVSILVFTYNGEKYILEQLNSLVNQSYKNIEILIFDDASVDNTVQIIRDFISRNSDFKIKLIQHKKNIGVLKNVEFALNQANGQYIAMCDQDDVWDQDKINLLVENIGNNILIYSNSLITDEKLSPIGKSITRKFSGKNYKAFWFSNYIPGHTMMFKKDLVSNILPIPNSGIHPDWYIAYIAAANGNIKFIDKDLVYYRQHNFQITKSDTPKDKKEQKIRHITSIFKSLLTYKDIDKKDYILLEELYNRFKRLKSGYFDIKLYKILNKNFESFFPYEKNKKMVFRLSKGLKFDRVNYILFIFLILFGIYYAFLG